MLKTLKELYARYERWLMPGTLAFGFVTDILTYRLITFDLAILGLVGHFFLAGLGIVTIQLYEDGLWRGKFFSYARLVSPLVLQYTFGSFFSAFLIFYFYSGSLLASWPFMSVLAFLMVANELFKKYNARPDIQLAAYFFSLFAFINLAIPYLIRDIGPKIFIASGLLSVALIMVFIENFCRYSMRVRQVRNTVIASVAVIFIAMNILYFTNFIPPIPLVIKDIGIFYNVEHTAPDSYFVIDRERSFWEKFYFVDQFPLYDGSEAYAFSAVFAPAKMRLVIVHEWQFKDPELGWITRNQVSFPAVGGREKGFRGFSKTSRLEPGLWRVNIRTETGQIIGRKTFKVVQPARPLILQTKEK